MYLKLSKAAFYRQAKKPVADETVEKRKRNHGRLIKISPRNKHLILRQIPILWEQYGSFTIKRLRVSTGVRKYLSDETVRRILHGAGYRFLHYRKKGSLKKDDLKKRCKFSRKVTKMLNDKFWEVGISFYIDAVVFQHKCNLHDKAWSTRIMAWRIKMKAYTLIALLKDLTWAQEKEQYISLWQYTSKRRCFMRTV